MSVGLVSFKAAVENLLARPPEDRKNSDLWDYSSFMGILESSTFIREDKAEVVGLINRVIRVMRTSNSESSYPFALTVEKLVREHLPCLQPLELSSEDRRSFAETALNAIGEKTSQLDRAWDYPEHAMLMANIPGLHKSDKRQRDISIKSCMDDHARILPLLKQM